MRLQVASIALLAVVAFELGARAQDEPDARAHRGAQELVDRGIAAFDRGRYQDAIEQFEQAYRIAPAPRLLYNIAQAYYKLGDSGCEGALRYFRRYREALKEAGEPVPAVVAARIAETRECVEQGTRRDPAAPAPGEVESPRDAPEPAVYPEEPEIQAARETPPPAGAPASSARRTAGWIVVGAGAAALLTGGVTGGLAIRKERKLVERCPSNDSCPDKLKDDVRTYERLRTTAIVSASVGLIAVGIGVWLLVTGRPDRGTARVTARGRAGRVQPWAGLDVVGVSVDF